MPMPISCIFVIPMMIAPARRSFVISGSSDDAMRLDRKDVPMEWGCPFTGTSSLTPMGTPSSRESAFFCRKRSADSAASFMSVASSTRLTNAFIGLSPSLDFRMLRRVAFTASLGVNVPLRYSL